MEADEVPGGSWLCPEVEDGSEFVLPGKLCMLFCDPQEEYGGGRLCVEDGSWAGVGATCPRAACGRRVATATAARSGASTAAWRTRAAWPPWRGRGSRPSVTSSPGPGTVCWAARWIYYYNYYITNIFNVPGLLQHRVPPVRGLLAHVSQHARSLQHRHVSRQAQGGRRLRAAVL